MSWKLVPDPRFPDNGLKGSARIFEQAEDLNKFDPKEYPYGTPHRMSDAIVTFLRAQEKQFPGIVDKFFDPKIKLFHFRRTYDFKKWYDDFGPMIITRVRRVVICGFYKLNEETDEYSWDLPIRCLLSIVNHDAKWRITAGALQVNQPGNIGIYKSFINYMRKGEIETNAADEDAYDPGRAAAYGECFASRLISILDKKVVSIGTHSLDTFKDLTMLD
ncbi:hypothetical protein GQ44DRAFT_721782 [Phaeosphaeriaceae sp. PMI808]|nr:hypothetical protein GQ44DRAFT_721782 [Phaeosphaeriaceae sp. PMI808]